MATSPQPEVVPLPFQLTAEDISEADAAGQTMGARSSVAGTLADDEERPLSKRDSLAKRLSQSSMGLLQSIAHRSERNFAGRENGGSQEELVVRRSAALTDDDRGSVAATIDDEDDRSTVLGEDGKSIEITAELGDTQVEEGGERKEVHKEGKDDGGEGEAQTTAGPQSEQAAMAESVTLSKANSGNPNNDGTSESGGDSLEKQGPADESNVFKKDRSSAAATSAPVALTKDALPEPLSRTALKYRTNEWVKHSTSADAPEPDEIHMDDFPASDGFAREEAPAPLNVEELQQTARTGAPAPAQPSKAGTAPSHEVAHNDIRGQLSAHRSSTARLSAHPIAEEPSNSHTGTVAGVADEDPSSSRISITPSPMLQSDSVFKSPAPGVVPYTNPQTLLGRRESYLRNKSLGPTPYVTAGAADHSVPFDPIHDEAGSIHNHPSHSHSSRSRSPDDDDMPLSQRRTLIRKSSMLGGKTSYAPPRAVSGVITPSAIPGESTPLSSHQPQRVSSVPSAAARQAQLASFRQSVAADLRAGTPIMSGSGRESALMGSYGASSTSLHGGGGLGMDMSRDLEVQRAIEAQRTMMLSKKEAEAQAKEMERWEKVRNERAFEERMRSGELLDAHKEAMRRLQGSVRH